MDNQVFKALTVCLALFCLSPSVKASDGLFSAVMSYCYDKGCKSGAFYYHFKENIGKYCSGVRYVNSKKIKSDRIKYIESMVVEEGLPANISLMTLVESSLDPIKTSDSGAVGIWQFKADTGRDMGLIINSTVDERKDVKASTQAAIKYLYWLKEQFNGDLDLSVIAYNAGIGKVKRLMKKYGTDNPWLIAKGLLKGKEAEHYLARYYGYSIAMYGQGVCDESNSL
jgi:membrane-bound lytic murein transglycosylase MltF